MKKLDSKLADALKNAPEAGPVYAPLAGAPTETVTIDNADVKISKGQYGHFLTINVEGVGTKPVTVRVEQGKEPGTNFRLELHEAIRELPAAGNRRAIAKGAQKVFAIAI